MLRVLSRRWLSVPGWVYLLSLALAGMMFWLLPVSHVLHQWTIEGTAFVNGFIENNTVMEVCSYPEKDSLHYHLNLVTGEMERINKPETENRRERNWSEQMPFELSHVKSFIPTWNELLLNDLQTSVQRKIECLEKDIFIADVYVGFTSRCSAKKLLTTSGPVAMSKNKRWLLMQKNTDYMTQQMMDLFSEDTMQGSIFPYGFDYQLVIVDLHNDQLSTFELPVKGRPEYVVHPDSSGFAALNMFHNSWGTPRATNQITTITWFPLPLESARHSLRQWLFIISCFVVPVLLSMTLHQLRSRLVARTPVTAPPHP